MIITENLAGHLVLDVGTAALPESLDAWAHQRFPVSPHRSRTKQASLSHLIEAREVLKGNVPFPHVSGRTGLRSPAAVPLALAFHLSCVHALPS